MFPLYTIDAVANADSFDMGGVVKPEGYFLHSFDELGLHLVIRTCGIP